MDDFSGGYFTLFRTVPGPSLYGPNASPVTQDVLAIGLIVAFAITWVCIFLAAIGALLADLKKFARIMIRASAALYIFTSLLTCIWSDSWRAGHVHTETAYKHFSNTTISAEVGLKIGLYGFNVTLKGNPTNQSGDIIDYKERYQFGMLQGRLGFGPQAGLINQQYREAQQRGTPLPILWIAEYFTLDGEMIRWGRNHRQAGYYTALLLWTAFCFFTVTVLALWLAVFTGTLLLMLTGMMMMASCGVYAWLHQDVGPDLAIPFETATLSTSYGWAFKMTLVNGAALVIASVALNLLYSYAILGDPTKNADYDAFVHTKTTIAAVVTVNTVVVQMLVRRESHSKMSRTVSKVSTSTSVTPALSGALSEEEIEQFGQLRPFSAHQPAPTRSRPPVGEPRRLTSQRLSLTRLVQQKEPDTWHEAEGMRDWSENRQRVVALPSFSDAKRRGHLYRVSKDVVS